MNPNDEIREQILRYFYDRNRNATSRFGKKGSAVKISDAKRELKDLHGLKQTDVMSNLTYLIDRGWVKEIDQEKTVSTKRGTTIPSVVTFYVITAQGIEKLEAPSDFEPKERYAGINIQATGSNVITLGDGNVVNAEFRQLFNQLTELKEAISSSDKLTEDDKLNVVVDIETLKDQLAKPKPDGAIARLVWPRIEQAATLAGLAGFAMEVGEAIARLT